MALVNQSHGIVEACGMSHTSIVAGHHVLVSGARVWAMAGKTPCLRQAVINSTGSREFGRLVPTLQTLVFLKQRFILFSHGSLDPLNLAPSLL